MPHEVNIAPDKEWTPDRVSINVLKPTFCGGVILMVF